MTGAGRVLHAAQSRRFAAFIATFEAISELQDTMTTNPDSNSQAQQQPQQQEDTKPARSFGAKLWHGWIKPMGAAVLAVVTFRSAVADWNDVPSQSMEPTILIGDRIFVNKLAYDLKVPFTTIHLAQWGNPERGDIVVFFSPADGRRMVKRVVGIPGDEIAMRNNQLLINGQPVSYATIGEELGVDTAELADPAPHQFALEHLGDRAHKVMVQPMRPAQRSFRPVTVPSGHYFLLGDNRDNSGDSRIFGFVPREQIVGKAIGLAFSLDTDNGYAPRWSRFLRSIE